MRQRQAETHLDCIKQDNLAIVLMPPTSPEMEKHRNFTAAACGSILLVAASGSAFAQSSEFTAGGIDVQAETIASGLDHPWALEFLPDGAVLVTERSGAMRIVQDGEVSDPLAGVPEVYNQRQGGLLDVALANNFETTGEIYISYSERTSEGAGTAIARATLVRDGEERLEDVERIFTMEKKTGTSHHFGSRIVVGPDGTLFFTIGDRGDGPRAQDKGDHAGSVLHIGPDGSIPADNPWIDTAAIQPELWSIGHRNPQGAVWDPVTGSLWTVEHGAKGGDEVNQPKAGLNYGWPEISYGTHYSGAEIGRGTQAEGFEQPVYYWDPSIAPGGMDVYQGAMFPEWQDDFLVAALKFRLVSRLERDENGMVVGEERIFEDRFGRIRDVKVASDGAVWLLTDESNGQLIRISRAD